MKFMENINSWIDEIILIIKNQSIWTIVLYVIFAIVIFRFIKKIILGIIGFFNKKRVKTSDTPLTIIKDISSQLKFKDEILLLKTHAAEMLNQFPITSKKVLHILLPGSLVHKYTGKELIIDTAEDAFPKQEDPIFSVVVNKVLFKVNKLSKVEIEITNNSLVPQELNMGTSRTTILKWFQMRINGKDIKLINAEFSDSIKGYIIEPQKTIYLKLDFQELSRYQIRNICRIDFKISLKFKGSQKIYPFIVEKNIDTYIEKNARFLYDNGIEVKDFLCIFAIGGVFIFPLIFLSFSFLLNLQILFLVRIVILLSTFILFTSLNFKVLEVFNEFNEFVNNQNKSEVLDRQESM